MKMKKRLLSILLSLALVLGLMPGMSLTAYAAPTETLLTTITATGIEQASYSTANVATVSFSRTEDGGSSYLANWGWWGYGWSATVTAVDGYTITKCVFYDDANRTATDSSSPFVVETTEEDKTPKVNGTPILANTSKGIKKIEVYGYFSTPSATFSVTVTPGSNMTKTTDSGAANQSDLSGAMTDVVYTANNGYYFPTDYSVAAVNGISVTRNSYTQITVSGTPTADAAITLTAPTAKTTPDAPTTAAATDCTTADNNDGKLTGVTTAMEYKKSDAADWTAGTGSDITGLVPGTYYVRVEATETTNASTNQELTIKGFISYTVTFKVVNGKWNEGEGDAATADKTVTLTGHDGDTLKLTADQIPAVGTKPNDTYKAGSWDTTPSADTAITGATTYTYTYAQKDTISQTVTFKVINGKWDDDTTADKTVTLTGYEGDTLKLAANQIPAVGTKPNDTYKAGSWDVTPSTETEITEATTYTYTYAQKDTISQTVTFKVVNGKWDDDTTADKTVTLTGYEGNTLKLTADQIPAVGSKPNDTYKAGSWDVTPSTETAITEATTYTYTYAQKDTISQTVTFKVVNGSWNDETTTDKTVTLTGYEGDTLKLTADQIPAVGSKPNDTYKAGSWDVTPSTDTAITAATTYTYTYAQKASISRTVTFKVVNGKWDDETTADKTVTLTGYEGDTLKLASNQIPAVGNKPNDTYKAGSWDVTPSTETAITENTTYTYTYAAKEASVVTKVPEAKTLTYNGSAQELVTAGTATGGTMQYAIGTKDAATEPYTTSIPTATNAGTYYVWYKVKGDANHKDTDPNHVSVTIAKKTLTITAGDQTIEHDGEIATGTDLATAATLAQGDTLTAVTLTPGEGKITPSAAKIMNGQTDRTDCYEITYVDGTLTVKPAPAPAPSGGGSSTPATVTIPVSSEDGKTSANVTVQVSGSTATVTSADVDNVLNAKDVGNVTVNVESLNKTVDEVVLPAALVGKVAKAVADNGNDASGLEIKLPTGTVTFDATTVATLAKQSDGKDLKVHLDNVSQATLTNAQQNAVKDMNALVVLDAYVTADGKRISDFKGGKATFSVPVELKDGQVPEGVAAFFVDDNGDMTEIPCNYDSNTATATGTVEHFSNYVVTYDESRVTKAEPQPEPEPEPEPTPGPATPTDIGYDDLSEAEKKDADAVASALGVDKDTAAAMVKAAAELGVSMDTVKLSGAALAKMNVDSSDPAGADFGKLRARVTKRTNSALTLKWTKQKNADGYLIYGNKCGKGNKMKLIKTVKKNKTVSFTQKKLKKGTYYKYMVVAYKNVNGQKMPIAASVVLHAPTKGGKLTVAKSVKVTDTKKKAITKASVKKGKTFQLKATEVKEEKKLKVKTHRAVKFESSDPKIAKVNAKGKITGVKKGTCTVWAYAQNGIFKAIQVTVK